MKRKRALPSSSRVDCSGGPELTPVPVSDPVAPPPEPTSRAPTLELGRAILRLSGIVSDVGASLALLDDSVDRAQAVGGAFELAQGLAARAVVAAGAPPGDTAVGSSEADARNALALFTDLGVVDVPVSR